MENATQQQELPLEQTNQLLLLQKNILEAMALDMEPQEILNALCLATEAIVEQSVASIMLLDEHHESLYVRAAPSIPDEVISKLNGLVPGDKAGSCGTAVYNGTAVYVEDILNDPLWSEFTEFTHEYRLRACWSQPIQNHDNRIVGTFALTSFITRPPDLFQKRLLNIAANIAGIVLQRETQKQALWQLAHNDPVTGLPNRGFLHQQLNHAILSAARKNNRLAVLFIDLDRFKFINDTHGHKVGDQVLTETARRIQNCIRSGDTAARYGGDEFVVLVENLDASYNVGTIADKILSSLAGPMTINATRLKVTPSIGISLYPEDGTTAEVLLNHADTAMYQAKTNGRNAYVCYEPALTEAIQYRHRIEKELKLALKNNELLLHYQPQCQRDNKQDVSLEALVRWQHPEKGLLYPEDFIPIAEQSGLIRELGQWVVRTACQQARYWLDQGYKIGRIAINISALQIYKDCFQIIQQTLNETGLPAEHLEIEITESMMVQQNAEANRELEHMRAAGLSIALDDFGSGYSSLSQLQSLPINKLKIDTRFITQLHGEKRNEIITRTIIAMGRSLGLNVIAEGVETQEQLDFISQEGCDAFQGYYYSRPLSVEEIENKLGNQSLRCTPGHCVFTAHPAKQQSA